VALGGEVEDEAELLVVVAWVQFVLRLQGKGEERDDLTLGPLHERPDDLRR